MENKTTIAEIALEQEHLRYVEEQMNDLLFNKGYSNDDVEIYFLNFEKDETKKRIEALKSELKAETQQIYDTCTGKIEIIYENIPDDKRFELYRFLNSIYLSTPGFNYKTVENTTKYSKDFCYEQGRDNRESC